jgi:hypothetical protein
MSMKPVPVPRVLKSNPFNMFNGMYVSTIAKMDLRIGLRE